MKNTIDTKLDFTLLIKLAEDKGLTVAAVLEANLVNIAMAVDDPAFQHYIMDLKDARNKQRESNLTDLQLYCENLLIDLPTTVAGIVYALHHLGTVDIPRGVANWKIIEGILVENCPAVAAELKTQANNSTVH